MEKFIDFIDNFFATRRITYYIMLGISVAAIIICIASAAIYLLTQMDNRFVCVKLDFLTVCSRCGFLSYPSYRRALHLW